MTMHTEQGGYTVNTSIGKHICEKPVAVEHHRMSLRRRIKRAAHKAIYHPATWLIFRAFIGSALGGYIAGTLAARFL